MDDIRNEFGEYVENEPFLFPDPKYQFLKDMKIKTDDGDLLSLLHFIALEYIENNKDLNVELSDDG